MSPSDDNNAAFCIWFLTIRKKETDQGGGKRRAGNWGTCGRARSYWDGATAPRGIFAMTIRDDLASSHIPPIDWAELFVSGTLLTMIAAAVLVFIH